MECPIQTKAAEIVIDYCAGTLESRRKTEFERHLDACAECSRVVQAQRELWETLDQWTPRAVAGFRYAFVRENRARKRRANLDAVAAPGIPASGSGSRLEVRGLAGGGMRSAGRGIGGARAASG